MIQKDIQQIEEHDLEMLVRNSVIEGRTLEYKKCLPTNSDHDKKEFLADVSSFANCLGGDILYGISSDSATGLPKIIEGINITNVDKEISRLDSSLRDGVDPRIPGFSIRAITLSNSKVVIIIRISKSWTPPHRVTYKGLDKFYSRSTNGKYPLDVSELRNAFNLSLTTAEKIRNFRIERTTKILSDETPISLTPGAKSVLHIIPLISFNAAQSYDVSSVTELQVKLRPLCTSGWDHRYNLDGFLTYSGSQQGKHHSYVQLFKSGIVEAVDAAILSDNRGDSGLTLHSVIFESVMMEGMKDYCEVLKTLGVDLPAYIFLSLLNVRHYRLQPKNVYLGGGSPIDRDHLFVPEGIIERYDIPPKDILRPCFDSIWNACGFARSFNYDNTGKWSKQ